MRKRILVSKCLLECCYRYDGKDVKREDLKEKLKDFEIIAVCPEVEFLNLPVPRPRLKFVPIENQVRLIKEDDKRDLTEELRRKSEEFIKSIGKIDCAILKSKSPSCGVGDAKVYKCLECEDELGRRNGIFTEELIKLFPNITVLSEKEFLKEGEKILERSKEK